MTCSPYKIRHLGQRKKFLLCNNSQKVLQKVLMKMHFGLWNCLKIFINLVMKVVSILANCQSLCICTTRSVVMVRPTNHLPFCCNFCLIFFLQMLSCQNIVMRLRRLLRIWAWAMRRFMLVLKIVFYTGRRMPTLKVVQTVTVQDGKVMSLNINKVLMPTLQRLFMSPKTANHMKWHANGRVNDGLLRHPANFEAWKSFDSKYIKFSSEPRNVRLGLA